jgi:hypothetical protein
MESHSRYVVSIEPDHDAWLVRRPQWSPLRYLREEGALENAELMAKLHRLTTGEPADVVLRSARGDRVVRSYG